MKGIQAIVGGVIMGLVASLLTTGDLGIITGMLWSAIYLNRN